jgi:hypothetical protein
LQGGPSGGEKYRADLTRDIVANLQRNPEAMSSKQKEMFSRTHGVTLTVSATKRDRWANVRDSWEMAGSFVKSIASRGILQNKEAPASTVNEREVSCFGGTYADGTTAQPCTALAVSKDGTHRFCNECGCGDKEIAHLDGGKLTFPYLECPRSKRGFSNAQPHQPPPPEIRPPEGALIFDAEDGGVGDCVVFAWICTHYLRQGREVWFRANSPARRDTLRLLGYPTFPSDGKGIPMQPIGNTFVGFEQDRLQGLPTVSKYPSRLHWYGSFLEGNPQPSRPTIHLTEEEEAQARKMRAELGNENLVLFFPKSSAGCRDWPLAYFSDLAYALQRMGVPSVAVCPSEEDFKSWGRFFPKSVWGYPLPIVAGLAKLSVSVGVDTGPTHLAATMGGPTLALMGPTRNVFTAYGPQVQELWVGSETVGCSGCFFNHQRGFRVACDDRCEALVAVKPPVVFKEIQKWLRLPDPGSTP